MSSECVLIEDEDPEVYPVEISDDYFEILPSLNGKTIILDDDAPVKSHNNNNSENGSPKNTLSNKLDTNTEQQNEAENEATVNKNISETTFARMLKNNNLIEKLKRKCKDMPNHKCMLKWFDKSLLPAYRDLHNSIKESSELTTSLEDTLKAFKTDPDHKFLHVVKLFETFKSGLFKKKVPFVTLTNNLTPNLSKTGSKFGLHNINHKHEKCKKPLKTSGIVINKKKLKKSNKKNTKSNTDNCNIINLDDDNGSDSDVIVLDENSVNENHNRVENYVALTNSNIQYSQTNIQTDDTNIPTNNKTQFENIHENNLTNPSRNKTCSTSSIDKNLLVPAITTDYVDNMKMSEVDKAKRIAYLEQSIGKHKEIITLLEQQEVTTDDEFYSPYLRCAKLKEEIVNMYKEICRLTDSEESLFKRFEIRLKVQEGYPPGPTRRLEKFLMKSKDESGIIPLPDFQDVVKCVRMADYYDNLNWSNQRIMSEALKLFKQCGQALRKRRQKREYKDLMSLVQDAQMAEDPAEKDQELMIKLEENKLIARVKEEQLFESFANLERGPSLAPNGLNSLQDDNNDSDSGSETDSGPSAKLSKVTDESGTNCAIDNSKEQYGLVKPTFSEQNQNDMVSMEIGTKVTPCSSIQHNTFSSNTSHCVTKLGIHVVTTITENIIPPAQSPKITFSTPTSSINFESENINKNCTPNLDLDRHSSSILSSRDVSDILNNETKELNKETVTNVKQEPIDWQSVLDSLGDNYTSCIYDIEESDPFLIIDISSDSSSDES